MNFVKLDKKINDRCDEMILSFPSKAKAIEVFRKDCLGDTRKLKRHMQYMADSSKQYLNEKMTQLLVELRRSEPALDELDEKNDNPHWAYQNLSD